MGRQRERREENQGQRVQILLTSDQPNIVLLRINWARKGFSFDKSLQLCKIFLSK